MNINDINLYQYDQLTGCQNIIGLLHTLDQIISSVNLEPYSILYSDMNGLSIINETKGRQYGDSAIRWMSIVLEEETQSEVFRISNDDFVVILYNSQDQTETIGKKLVERFNNESNNFGVPEYNVTTILIHYDCTDAITPVDVFYHMVDAMRIQKMTDRESFQIIHAGTLSNRNQTQIKNWKNDFSIYNPEWLPNLALSSLLTITEQLFEAKEMAFTDAITQLPNMRSAQIQLQQIPERSNAKNTPYAILLLDGDNLRVYNEINYAEGDIMLKDLSSVIRNQIRPDDFVARWRSGDEFIVILPDTNISGAQSIAERIRMAVKEESLNWRYPITISIGISGSPVHGTEISALLEKAEAALKKAKEQGKNCSILFTGTIDHPNK